MYLLMRNYIDFPDPSDILDYIEIDIKDAEKELKKISGIIRNEPTVIDNFNNTDSIPFEDFAEYIDWENWDPLNLENLEEID